jgi:hypothetical protein
VKTAAHGCISEHFLRNLCTKKYLNSMSIHVMSESKPIGGGEGWGCEASLAVLHLTV